MGSGSEDLFVCRACCGVKKSLDAPLIQKALDELRLKVIAVRNRNSLSNWRETSAWAGGEAEAIVLALTEKAQVLGIDDKNGINACNLLGIAFTTDHRSLCMATISHIR